MPTDTGTDRVMDPSRPPAGSFNDRFVRAGVPTLGWLIALWMAHDVSGRASGGTGGAAPMRLGFVAMGLFTLLYAWTRRRREDARWDVLTFAALTLMFFALSLR
jgi:hypothetical protein